MTFSVVLQEDTYLRTYETKMLPKMVCGSKLNKVNQFICIFDSKHVKHYLSVQQEMPLLLADRQATLLHLQQTVSLCLSINDFICL